MTNERDDIAYLVKLGGRRPEVPRERLDRARSAARAEWRNQLEARKRSRRRRALVGLAAAAVLILAIAIPMLTHDAATPSAVVETRIGDVVAEGEEVRTGADGGASLRFATGHSLRLGARTRIRIDGPDAIVLEHGILYADSGVLPIDPIEIRTPFGTVREIGTQFELRLDDESLRVRVREGAVVVDGEHEVRTGTELTLGKDGSARARAVAIHGDEWSWLGDVTPVPALDGMTASAFLDWIARERGWQLVFADESTAGDAEETVLGGTISTLTIDAALDVVLPTCRMTYRVEDGTLIVSSDREP